MANLHLIYPVQELETLNSQAQCLPYNCWTCCNSAAVCLEQHSGREGGRLEKWAKTGTAVISK